MPHQPSLPRASRRTPSSSLGRLAPVALVGLLAAGCSAGGTTTVIQAPTSTEAAPPSTSTYTPPPTTDAAPTTTEDTGPTKAERRRERRIDALEESAERETRKFFTAVRDRDTSGVCSRLTNAQVNQLGGRSSCGNGRFVKESAVRQVPPSNRALDFTIVLTSNNTRATALIRHPERRYAVRLARQGGQWRIDGFRRLGSS